MSIEGFEIQELDMRVDVAYRALIRHTYHCDSCRRTGVNCPAADRLKFAYRATRLATLPTDEPVIGDDVKALGTPLRASLKRP